MKEEALRKQNEAYQAQFATQLNQWKPSAYEEALNKEGIDWMNATSGKEPMDVSKLPGMSPYLDIYNAAMSKQKGQRMGLGSLRFGAGSANPNLMGALELQDESHRKQDAAQQLNQAYAIRNAEVRGTALPLINIGEGRAVGKTSAVGGMAINSNNAWAQHSIRPGFWANMLNSTMQGAAQGATMAAAA